MSSVDINERTCAKSSAPLTINKGSIYMPTVTMLLLNVNAVNTCAVEWSRGGAWNTTTLNDSSCRRWRTERSDLKLCALIKKFRFAGRMRKVSSATAFCIPLSVAGWASVSAGDYRCTASGLKMKYHNQPPLVGGFFSPVENPIRQADCQSGYIAYICSDAVCNGLRGFL